MIEELIKAFAEERGLSANYPREDIIKMMLEAGEIVESDTTGLYRIPEYEQHLSELPPGPDQEPEDEDEDSEYDDDFFTTIELESPAPVAETGDDAEFDEDEEDLF